MSQADRSQFDPKAEAEARGVSAADPQPPRILLGNATYEVVSSHRFDEGGMFKATAGVVRDGDGFKAFVRTGWGGGGMSKQHPTAVDAANDLERLKARVCGE